MKNSNENNVNIPVKDLSKPKDDQNGFLVVSRNGSIYKKLMGIVDDGIPEDKISTVIIK